MTHDSGNFDPLLDQALALVDHDGFAARKAGSESRGKSQGLGFPCFIEFCDLAPSAAVGALGRGVGQRESANIKFDPTGTDIDMPATPEMVWRVING